MIFFDQMPFNQAMFVLYFIVAVAAIAGIFLTYFYRPIKIEIRKRHSDDLRKLVEDWKVEVPIILDAYKAEKSEPTPLELPVEKKRLFSDFKNHMPPDLNVLDVWKTFKSKYNEYARKRYRLFKDICNEAVTRTGLDFKWKGSNYEWKEGRISSLSCFYIESIYWDAFNIVDGGHKHYDKMNYNIEEAHSGYILRSRMRGEILAWGSSKEVVRKAESIHKDMINRLEDFDYVGKAKSLLDDQKALEERREGLLITLNDFISIPIFPKECEHINRSIYGIPYQLKYQLKGVFYWLKRHF